jgi:hypothetical protein
MVAMKLEKRLKKRFRKITFWTQGVLGMKTRSGYLILINIPRNSAAVGRAVATFDYAKFEGLVGKI